MIAVPESVAFYWGDPVNTAAVNVLAGSVDVPGDLGLAEAERFELAALASRRVRVDFWRLLRQLWSETWGEAVRTAMPTARLLTYGGHQAYTSTDPYADPSADYAWEARRTSGVFRLSPTRLLFTGLALSERDRELGLQFYVGEGAEDWTASDDLDLGSDWTDDGDHRRTTAPGLLLLDHAQAGIDTERLARLASDAAAAMATVI